MPSHELLDFYDSDIYILFDSILVMVGPTMAILSTFVLIWNAESSSESGRACRPRQNLGLCHAFPHYLQGTLIMGQLPHPNSDSD